MGASATWLPIYRESGMRDLYIGDEAIVDVQSFSLAGGKKKGLRQAVNRIAKYGYTIEFHDPSAIAPELETDLRELMVESRRGVAETVGDDRPPFRASLPDGLDPVDVLSPDAFDVVPEPVGVVLECIELSLERVEVVTRPVAVEPNAVQRMSHRITLARMGGEARPDAKLMISKPP